MLEDCHFVFFLNSKFHFSDLESLFKLTGLGLEVLPSALFLPSSLITLIQVTTQVLYLLLLLPEYLTELVCGVPHVLKHVS